VLEAIKAALRLAASAPPSEELERLQREADSLCVTIESWRIQPPTAGEREHVLNQVLLLHTEAARLTGVENAPLGPLSPSEPDEDEHERPREPGVGQKPGRLGIEADPPVA